MYHLIEFIAENYIHIPCTLYIYTLHKCVMIIIYFILYNYSKNMYGYQNKNVHEQDWDGGCKYKRIIKNIILK